MARAAATTAVAAPLPTSGARHPFGRSGDADSRNDPALVVSHRRGDTADAELAFLVIEGVAARARGAQLFQQSTGRGDRVRRERCERLRGGPGGDAFDRLVREQRLSERDAVGGQDGARSAPA
jgi:hypothetical protein